MKLVADEDVDRHIVEQLRNEGYEVVYVAELARSISDDEVLELANNENALLVTADKILGSWCFASIVLQAALFCCGCLVLGQRRKQRL